MILFSKVLLYLCIMCTHGMLVCGCVWISTYVVIKKKKQNNSVASVLGGEWFLCFELIRNLRAQTLKVLAPTGF